MGSIVNVWPGCMMPERYRDMHDKGRDKRKNFSVKNENKE
jgi:hypothetical protein